MSEQFPPEFIEQIPKTDLHVHLDGSLRLSSLIEMAKEDDVELPSMEEAGLKELVFKDAYENLPEYLKGFQYTCAVLQSPDHLERAAYELARDNLDEGVRYVEVRFAPQLHTRRGFPMEEVVRAVCRGLDRAKSEFNRSPDVQQERDIPFEYGIIVCALRFFTDTMSPYYSDLCHLLSHANPKLVFATASQELARAAVTMVRREGLPVVGFDLAGAEAGFPAEDHRAAFQYAHDHFLKKTVHAGEAYGPESIFQAITQCHANRIGHGTFLFAPEHIQDPGIEDAEAYSENLAEYIASQRITIEVNLTSNLQTTPSLKTIERHPLRNMLERDMSVSICTDNRLVSNTTVTKEIQLAVEHLPVCRKRLRNMVVAGFKGSFFRGSYSEKRNYVRNVLNRYEALEAEYLGSPRS